MQYTDDIIGIGIGIGIGVVIASIGVGITGWRQIIIAHGLDKVLSTLLRLLMFRLTNPCHSQLLSLPLNKELTFHSLTAIH